MSTTPTTPSSSSKQVLSPPPTPPVVSVSKGKSGSSSTKFTLKNFINVPRLSRKNEEESTANSDAKRKKAGSRFRNFFRGSSPTRSEPGHQEDSSSIMSSVDSEDARGLQRSDEEIMGDLRRQQYFQPRDSTDVTAEVLSEALGGNSNDSGEELLDYGNITSRLWEHNRAREIVSGDLSKRVLDSYNDFVEGMQRIHEVGVNIQQSTTICASSRLSLKMARTTVTEAALEIAAKYRRQQRYLRMLETLKAVKTAATCVRDVAALLESDDLEGAVAALQRAQGVVAALRSMEAASPTPDKRLICVEGLEASVAKSAALVNSSVDTGMREVCQAFNSERYGSLLRAYTGLGRGFEVLNRLDECFTLDMDYRSKKVIMLFVDQNSRTFSSFQSIEKVCIDKAAADIVPDRMIDCLLNVFGVYLEIMWNFHTIRAWHDAHAPAQPSPDTPDIRPGIDRIRRKLWLAMERYVVELLRCVSLAKFQVEDALTVVEATNLFVKAGMAFCPAADPDMIQATLTDVVRAYFGSVKASMTEDVLTLLENEQWSRVPISIRVSSMKELQGLQSARSSLARCNVRAIFGPQPPVSPATNPFYGSARKMVLGPEDDAQDNAAAASAQRGDGDDKDKSGDESGTDYNEIDDNAQELAGQFVDDGGSADDDDDDIDDDNNNNGNSRKGKSSSQPSSSAAAAAGGGGGGSSVSVEEATVTNSVITIVKKLARYLRMMQVLDSISVDIFHGITTIFDSYVWTVWSWFVVNLPPESGTFKASRVLEGLKATAEKADVLGNIISDASSAVTGGGSGSGSGSNSSGNSGGVTGASSSAAAASSSVSQSSVGDGSGSDGSERAVRMTSYQDSIAPTLPEGFVPPAAALPSAELNDPGCLYGLGKRIVAVESLLFFKDAMVHIKPALLAFIGKEREGEVEVFYRKNVERTEAIRVYMYRCIAPFLTSVEQAQTMIEKHKWDSFSNSDAEKNYITLVKKEATTLSTKLDALRRRDKVPQAAVVLIWESVILNIMDVLLEGYSRVRKCSNEGRAEMALDLQTLAVALGEFTGLQPVPGLTIVDAYIKAFFVTDEDFLEMCRKNTCFTQKMLTNLFACQSAQLSRKQKIEFQSSIDEISKARVRKPLWQLVPQDQLKLARENALAPKKKRKY